MIDSLQRLIEFLRSLVTWWFVVEPWEMAVRVRAGKHLRLCGPGMHLRLPVFDAVYVHNVRRRVLHITSVTLSSSDGKVFVIGAAVSCVVSDALLLHTAVHDPQGVVSQRVWQVIAEYVSSRVGAMVRPEGLKAEIDAIDLRPYGLDDVEACVTGFAQVRTYRVIQEALGSWYSDDAHRLSTTTRKTP